MKLLKTHFPQQTSNKRQRKKLEPLKAFPSIGHPSPFISPHNWQTPFSEIRTKCVKVAYFCPVFVFIPFSLKYLPKILQIRKWDYHFLFTLSNRLVHSFLINYQASSLWSLLRRLFYKIFVNYLKTNPQSVTSTCSVVCASRISKCA